MTGSEARTPVRRCGSLRRRYRVVLLLGVIGCGDPAEFRPAKNAGDLPAVKDAYRVKDVDPSCQPIGVVVEAASIDAVARTAARHGGTHYRIANDLGQDELVTDSVVSVAGGRGYATGVGHSRSRVERTHQYVAHVFRCPDGAS